MKINAENIEEWMFDFHEGTLSESEKAEVLHFLHLHPELNDEFSGWAQTHALKNEAIQVPADLLEGILKPSAAPFYFNKFLLGTVTGVVLTSAIAGLWYLQEAAENKTERSTAIPTATTKGNSPMQPRFEEQEKQAIIQKNPNTNTLTVGPDHSEQKKKEAMRRLQKDSVIELYPNEVVEKEQNEVKADLKVEKREAVHPDSLPTVQPEPPTGIEAPETKEDIEENKKKKRGLLPFSIKPQSKFKPANSNF